MSTEYDLRHAKTDHAHRAREDDEVGIAACLLDCREAEFVVEPVEGLHDAGGHAALIRRGDDGNVMIVKSILCTKYLQSIYTIVARVLYGQ